MNLPQNIVTFLGKLPLAKMKGEDIFIAIAFFLDGGGTKNELTTKLVVQNWSKGVIGKKYNSAYFTRAKGRIHPVGLGKFSLTDEGVSYVQELLGEISTSETTLLIFQPGNTHSFDKFLRKVLKQARVSVDIADTYVIGDLFDNLIDEVSKTIPIRFIYGHDKGSFMIRAGRFARQYEIEIRESKQFHDRFLVIDGKGYIIGPSLKDAAEKKPATVVALNLADSKKMVDLFNDIWKTGI